ncbi:MAG TPA: alpha-glucan family phosphorylase, partial [Magnetospirillaceae bacterium]|nr:alpha-glucan family phosphorylase [Magnetospirillaceae bacterium]
EVQSRIIFLEDYDMTMARYMTSGSDLWLNTPKRPLEASGTSGMKAGVNGVLNCSVMDGWWDEGYEPGIGWAIGRGEEYQDEQLQNEVESKALFDLLEREIIPMFYARGRDNLPREWIRYMKASIRQVGKKYSSHRMLMEYADKYYFPALSNYHTMAEKAFEPARDVAAYLDRARKEWPRVAVLEIHTDALPIMERGDTVNVSARVNLAGLAPQDVAVELYHGGMSSQSEIMNPVRVEMKSDQQTGQDWSYHVAVTCSVTGQHGYSVRILPKHPALVHPFIPGLVRWA